MRILVTGASGFIGSHLVAALARQRHEVLRLSRAPLDPSDPRQLHWDPATGELDPAPLKDLDAVVHLAGQNLASGRWDEAFKAKLRASRVEGTRLLIERLAAAGAKPSVFVSASAIGIYGDRGAQDLDENSAAGPGFLAELCQAWEEESSKAGGLGCRVVQLRLGMVLGTKGGVLKRLILPFSLGLGGRVGSGEQYYSWISIQDLQRLFLWCLEQPQAQGVYNAVSPNPVTNAQFTRSLARALSRPAFFPMPAFAAKLAFGEMAEALLLGGQKVLPARLKAQGFTWEHPYIGEGLSRLLQG